MQAKREMPLSLWAKVKTKERWKSFQRCLPATQAKTSGSSSIDALITTGDKNIIEPLSFALKDLSSEVRQSALEALAEVGGENSQELIKGALNDEDNAVRELAQELLEDFKEKK